MALAEFFEVFFEDDAGSVVVQVRETAVATEGDEVVVTFGLVTLKTAWHEVIVTSNILEAHPCAVRLRMNGAPRVSVGFMYGPPAMNGAPKMLVGFYVWATRPPASLW